MEMDFPTKQVDLAIVPLQGTAMDNQYQRWTEVALTPLKVDPQPQYLDSPLGPAIELGTGSKLFLGGLPLTRTGRKVDQWLQESRRSTWCLTVWIRWEVENPRIEFPWVDGASPFTLGSPAGKHWELLKFSFGTEKRLKIHWGNELLGEWIPEDFSPTSEVPLLNIVGGNIQLTGVHLFFPCAVPLAVNGFLAPERGTLNQSLLAKQVQSPSSESLFAPPEPAPQAAPLPAGLPPGTIVMWTGNKAPEGWLICDGSHNTPDLRNRFIVGAGKAYEVGMKGGQAKVALTQQEMPIHHHQLQLFEKLCVMGQQNDQAAGARKVGMMSPQRSNIPTQKAGSGKAHENRPPYYALSFIMKK